LYEVGLGLITANGTVAATGLIEESTETARTWYGLPQSLTRPGDLHTLLAEETSPGPTRFALLYAAQVTARTITFAPGLTPPMVGAMTGAPVPRLQAVGIMGAEGSALGGRVEVVFVQPDRAWVLSQTRSYSTASSFDLRTLVLTGVAGWNETLYGVRTITVADWTVEHSGVPQMPADGVVQQWLRFKGLAYP
jgi:hypothetical protein